MASRSRTALQALVQGRHLTRQQTIDVLEGRARQMGINDFALSIRQLDRWFAGDLATSPRPSVCRVLEAEFGFATDILLGCDNGIRIPQRTRSFGGTLSDPCIEFVNWLSDHSDRPHEDIYRDVSDSAGAHAEAPPAQRASRRHRLAGLQRAEITKALQAHYGPGHDSFYRATINDSTISLTILSNGRSIGLAIPLDGEHEMFQLDDSEPPLPMRLTAIGMQAAIERLAVIESSETVLVNRPLYRLLDAATSQGRLRASVGLTSFAAYALTSDLLETEPLDSLTVTGPPRASALPIRDLYLPSLKSAWSFRQRICVGGPACLVAVARPDDYLLLVQRRSDRVVNVTGRLAVIPKAFHQPVNGDLQDTALSATVLRELEEELLGRQDLDQLEADSGRRAALMHPLARSEPAQWLNTHPGSYSLECTAFGINMLSGNYELACLATIEDPTWWGLYGDRIEGNWETMQLRCYSSRDTNGLTQLVDDPTWSNEGLFAFIEGLRRLRQRRSPRVAIPRIDVTVT